MNDVTELDLLDLDRYAIGQPVPRSEDPVLVSGKGRFTDDVDLAGQAYCVIVRSHFAHGVIRSIDAAAARGMPGVLGVYTAAELEDGGIGPLPPRQVMNNRDGTPMLSPTRHALATHKVLYVGDPIAAVVAETLAEAKDAAEAVVVDIDPLPAVTTAREAAAPGAVSCTTMRRGMSGSISIMATARGSPRRLPVPPMSRGSNCATTALSSTRWSRAPGSRSTIPGGSIGPSMSPVRACSGSGATSCAS